MAQQPWDYIAKIIALGDSGSGKSSLTIRLCEGRFVSHHDVTIGVEFGSRVVAVGPPASLQYNINNPLALTSASSSSAAAVEGNSATAPARQSTDNAGGARRKGNSKQTSSSQNPSSSKPSATSKDSKETKQKHMKLSLWDTAGQETYKSITRSYFRGASGALLVFDITRRSTFNSVTAWLHDLRQIAEDDIVVVLVGNKSDLAPASLVSSSSSSDQNTASESGGGGGTGTGGSSAAAGANKRQVTRAEAEEWCTANRVLQYIETSCKSGENVERAFIEVAERIYQNIEAGKYDLNDKRSGVKGPSAGAGNQRAVTLKADDKAGRKRGGCC